MRSGPETMPVSPPPSLPSPLPPMRAVSGSSSGRIVFRFAAIQAGRSTTSSGGSSRGQLEARVVAHAPAKSCASGSIDAALHASVRARPPEPAISSPIRWAVPQSIVSEPILRA